MAHEDLNIILNELLPHAQDMLAKYDEFFPFGGSLRVDGEFALTAGWTGENQPLSQDVIEILTRGLHQQAQRGEIRAAALCIDVRTIPPGESLKTDAISLRLHHRNGEAVVVFLPYRKSPAGAYEYGELFAEAGERDIFPQSE